MSLLDKAVDKLTIDAVAEFAEHMLADARAGRAREIVRKSDVDHGTSSNSRRLANSSSRIAFSASNTSAR